MVTVQIEGLKRECYRTSLSLCAQHIGQNNAKTLEFGVWFITGPCKEMDGSCSKTPKGTESFHKAFLKANGERGVWLSVANFLVSDPFLSQIMVK